MKEANVFQALVAPEHWKALEQNEALSLNRMGYCGNTFASFRESYFISFSFFATRNMRSLI